MPQEEQDLKGDSSKFIQQTVDSLYAMKRDFLAGGFKGSDVANGDGGGSLCRYETAC